MSPAAGAYRLRPHTPALDLCSYELLAAHLIITALSRNIERQKWNKIK